MYEGSRYSHQDQTDADITGAAVHATVDVAERVRLIGWGFTVTTAIVHGTTVEGIETLQKLAHDRTTQAAIDAITVDADMAVGHVDYRDIASEGVDAVIQPGEAFQFETTTAPTGGAPAGAVRFFVRGGLAGDLWDSTYHHRS